MTFGYYALQTKMLNLIGNMKLKRRIVLIVALAIEAVNFRFGGLALDPGPSANLPWYSQLVAFQWIVLHALGLFATDWAYKIGIRRHDGLLIFMGGYVSTVLLLLATTFAFQRFLHWKWKRPK